MIKIIADDRIPYLGGILEPYAEVKYMPGHTIGPDDIRDADALLVRTRTKCSEELLGESAVKFIGTATIGFDHIDTEYCRRRGIKWINAPGCNSSSVQQYVIAALLKVAHDFNLRLKDKTIGIIGVGHVGSKVESFARIMGMKVLLNDPPRAEREGGEKFTGLDMVLAESDFISLHVPLTLNGIYKTCHMLDAMNLKRIGKDTWVINTSRGEVADTASLAGALTGRRIAGAVLDVWENEPCIDPDLLNRAFIATPHIAGYSNDGKANGTAMVVNRISEFFDLPLKKWYPERILHPGDPVISLEAGGKNFEDLLREAVIHTYDISGDDQRLRNSPADFEKQRGDYPVRREFPAYTLDVKGADNDVIEKLKALGFKVPLM